MQHLKLVITRQSYTATRTSVTEGQSLKIRILLDSEISPMIVTVKLTQKLKIEETAETMWENQAGNFAT